MSDLAQACADLTAWLPAAERLITEPDIDGTAGGAGKPGSAPPWNPAAAAAYYDIHAGVRDVEDRFRYEITGTLTGRGGSDANTAAAIGSIARLGAAASERSAADAARALNGWVTQVMQLPAIDLEERPQRIRAACPYCGVRMLRVFPRSGRVACLRAGACFDGDGNHPRGLASRSALDGTPQIHWSDGLVT